MQISIIGGGYVGLVTGACFADLGHRVAIINRDARKTDTINAGKSPIFEIGLAKLLKKHAGRNLHATTGYHEINTSDLSFICVGTPSAEDGSADLSMLKSAAQSIGEALRTGDAPHVVVVKSTVPPGTTEQIVIPLIRNISCRDDIGFAMNPEFLREGRAIEDFMHPDRVVIGAADIRSRDLITRAYEPLHAPVYYSGITAAEMVKYTSNALLATKISFANEIGNICKKLEIDVYEVMKGVGMDHRLSPHFLDAGIGFGGSCFPKDVRGLIHLAEELGEQPQLLRSVIDVNEKQPLKLVSLLEGRIGSLEGKRIAILGLAFKDNTDDIRDSRAIPVIHQLLKKHAVVSAFDPAANTAMKKVFPDIAYFTTPTDALKGADACLILTEWPEFKKLDKEFAVMRSPLVIEGRRILTYTDKEGICW